MTVEGWRQVVQMTFGDPEAEERLARLLNEQDEAKAAIQRMGYGCTGIPWPDLIKELEQALALARIDSQHR